MFLILIELYRYFIKWFFSLDHYRGWAWWVSLFDMLSLTQHLRTLFEDVVMPEHGDPELNSG